MSAIDTAEKFFENEPDPFDTVQLSPYRLIYALGKRVAQLEQAVVAVTAQLSVPSPPQTLPPFGSLAEPVALSTPRPAPDPSWIPVLHRQRISSPSVDPDLSPNPYTKTVGCGLPALYLIRMFTQTERADITAMRVCYPGEREWRQPKPGDVSLCSGCGMPINPFADRDVDYSSVLLPTPEVVRLPRKRRRSRPESEPLAAAQETNPPESAEAIPASIFGAYTPEARQETISILDHLQGLAEDMLTTGSNHGEDS